MTRKEEIEKESERIANNSFYIYDPLKPKATMKSCCKYMAEWCDSHPKKGLVDIEKVIEWLDKNADSYTWYDEMEGESGMMIDFIKDFRKAMLGEEKE